jgi:hypothetical protein
MNSATDQQSAIAPGLPPSDPTIQVNPLSPMASTDSSQAISVDSVSSNLLTADDKDVIEPEWVNKVKDVIRTTVDNPYKQSEQLAMIKVDYMRKRYNKELKLE